MSTARHHAEWLSLVEVSGPFLSMPVLTQVFAQELDKHDPDHARLLRQAYEEWDENQSGKRPDPAIHNAWIRYVLTKTLDLEEVLIDRQAISQTLKAAIPEQGETLRPDYVVNDPRTGKARLLVRVYPRSQKLTKPVAQGRWKASPDTRMMELLHRTEVRLGLVTNGDQWMLVNAPKGETTGYASWYSSLWFEEPMTLRAFRTLLVFRQFFGVPENETLESLLDRSAADQQEVTDQLGYQVRQAVEVLIHSLDRADQEHDRELLVGVDDGILYEAALTVMMRLVFLFCAEERGLLLLGDDLWDKNYAVSTLRELLRKTADQFDEVILESRKDAWSRLLTTFRAVFGGVQHDRFRLPPYGGKLFDPDRFPFLEGRKLGTSWRNTEANPLPINNRTVLHLLDALQVLRLRVPGGGPAEPRKLSFRALNIEQIGHVYEGLLDHTAKRATEPVLGLAGTRDCEPEISLSELEGLRTKGEKELCEYLKKATGRSSVSPIRTALTAELYAEQVAHFRTACQGDEELWKRIKPFAGLVRPDTFGYPVVILPGSAYMTAGTDRRSSGTHYTPRSLTEPIVQYTLEPLVFVGPAEGKPKEEWQLRPPVELLDLKICDMACGSGAFLVQACRYLAERLVEAWEKVEKEHPELPGITPDGKASEGKPGETLIPRDSGERVIYAQRLIAGRCLYGVDKNPLAAEMGKLSLWLLTLQKDKPFTFLDHAIRSGDSLVGIANTHQLTSFSLDGKGPDMPMFTDAIKKRLDAVRILRRQIAEHPDFCVEDVERKGLMLKNAEEQTKRLVYAANYLLAASWEGGSEDDQEDRLKKALTHVEYNFKDLPVEQLEAEGKQRLREAGCPKPFHWPLEFPEVLTQLGGFGGVVGNPPFLGGSRISTVLGDDYYAFIRLAFPTIQGRADFCCCFFLRGWTLLSERGNLGLIATNSISQADSREASLEPMVKAGSTIYRADNSRSWPGDAAVIVSVVHLSKTLHKGERVLNGSETQAITPFLDADEEQPTVSALAAQENLAFHGSVVVGNGFILESDEAKQLILANERNKKVILPYLNGFDVNSEVDHIGSRWIINFFNWPLDHETAPDDYSGPVANDYPECLAIVRQRVKPERDRLGQKKDSSSQGYARWWWQYGRRQEALYSRIDRQQRVLVRPRVSNTHAPVFLPTGQVFSDALVVFTMDKWWHFTVVQSTLHELWARKFSSTLKRDLRYSATDAFETFPFPGYSQSLDTMGERYYARRQQIMGARKEGLTKIYNRFHNVDEHTEDIQNLREMHAEMNTTVAAAYGWNDLALAHGFHDSKEGVRFTISEAARREVLARLLKLNYERYAEEVALGLHDKKKPKPSKGTKKTVKKADEDPLLFSEDE